MFTLPVKSSILLDTWLTIRLRVAMSLPKLMMFWLICFTCCFLSSGFFPVTRAQILFLLFITIEPRITEKKPKHVAKEIISWSHAWEKLIVSMVLEEEDPVLLLADMCDGFSSVNTGKVYFRYDEVPSARFLSQLASRGYLSQQRTNLWDGNFEVDQAGHKGRTKPNSLASYANDSPADELTRTADEIVRRMQSKQALDDRSATWEKVYTDPGFLGHGPLIDGQVMGTAAIHNNIYGRPVELPAAQRFGWKKSRE